MSMYKSIFVNSEYEGIEAGAQVQGINGEILIFGESAFASLEQAAASGSNSNSVVRVVSGKYDYYVIDADGIISPVPFVDFNGGVVVPSGNGVVMVDATVLSAAGFTAIQQTEIIAVLNAFGSATGTVFSSSESGSAGYFAPAAANTAVASGASAGNSGEDNVIIITGDGNGSELTGGSETGGSGSSNNNGSGEIVNEESGSGDGGILFMGGQEKTVNAETMESDRYFSIDIAHNENMEVVAGAELTLEGSFTTVVTIDGDSDDGLQGSIIMTGGEQFYESQISADVINIASDAIVTIDTVIFDFNTLNLAGTLNIDFSKLAAYTGSGEINGEGKLVLLHDGVWMVNQSVAHDFSGFTGTVSMANDDASIVLGLGDVEGYSSYFADGATVVIADSQKAFLAGDGVNTGIIFTGEGGLYIGNYDIDSGDIVESDGFTQTLTGDNAGFEGTLNVAEGATVTMKGNFGGEVNLDYLADGNELVTTLVLDGDGLEVSGDISGDENDIISVVDNAVLSGDNSCFEGMISVADEKTLDLSSETTYNGNFVGGAGAAININENLSFAGEDNSEFRGTITIAGEKALDLDSENIYNATFVGADDAIINVNADIEMTADNSSFGGVINIAEDITLEVQELGAIAINMYDDSILNLNAEAVYVADIAGEECTLINANENIELSGDISCFEGEFNVAKELTLSGTFGEELNVFGDTVTLANDEAASLTVNSSGTLDTLNIGENKITLEEGIFNNVYGESDSVLYLNTYEEGKLENVNVGTVMIYSDNDIEVTGNFGGGNIYFTIDDEQNGVADLILSGTVTDDINIRVDLIDEALVDSDGYILINGDIGGKFDDKIYLVVVDEGQGVLALGGKLIINGNLYTLEYESNTLSLKSEEAISDFVVVNWAWSGFAENQLVDDEGVERFIGYDAAGNLRNAVNYIKAKVDGKGTIEIAADANYTANLTLMTENNGVTDMTLRGRGDNGKGTVQGDVIGSEGTDAVKLTIEKVTISGGVYGGGTLVINNTAANKINGIIAAGQKGGTSDIASGVSIHGGNFTGSMLIGGGYAINNDLGSTLGSLVLIQNNSADQLTIAGQIIGGNIAYGTTVDQSGVASVIVDVSQSAELTYLRGNIYAAGGALGGGTLNVSGDRSVTFTGDASKLSFTGMVYGSGYGKNVNIDSDSRADLLFTGFTGQFNGAIAAFNTVTLIGDTALSLGRRQTGTASTDLVFDVSGRTDTNNAMYTVRDKNSWEFEKTITVSVADNDKSGIYVLVNNYIKSYDDFNFTVAGNTDYELGQTVTDANNNSYKLIADGDKLLLEYVSINSKGIVAVNSDWAGKDGQIVEVDGVKFMVGFNAFANLKDANDNVDKDGIVKIVQTDETEFIVTKNQTWTGNVSGIEKITVNSGVVWVNEATIDATGGLIIDHKGPAANPARIGGEFVGGEVWVKIVGSGAVYFDTEYDNFKVTNTSGGAASNVYANGNKIGFVDGTNISNLYLGAKDVQSNGTEFTLNPGMTVNHIYMGGNGAEAIVTGDSKVILLGGAVYTGTLYGNGSGSSVVSGTTSLVIGDGTEYTFATPNVSNVKLVHLTENSTVEATKAISWATGVTSLIIDGTVDSNGFGATLGAVNLTGISGAGTVIHNAKSTATMTVRGNLNDFSGTLINNSAVEFKCEATNSGDGTINIENNSTGVFNITGAQSGTTEYIIKSGNVKFTSLRNFSGSINALEGADIQIGSNVSDTIGESAARAEISIDGGTLWISSNSTFNGNISGTGTLLLDDQTDTVRTVTFNGDNSGFEGKVIIGNNDILTINSNAAGFQNAGSFDLNNGILRISAPTGQATDLTINQKITGSDSAQIQSAAKNVTLTIAGDVSEFTGTFGGSSGIIEFADSAALADTLKIVSGTAVFKRGGNATINIGNATVYLYGDNDFTVNKAVDSGTLIEHRSDGTTHINSSNLGVFNSGIVNNFDGNSEVYISGIGINNFIAMGRENDTVINSDIKLVINDDTEMYTSNGEILVAGIYGGGGRINGNSSLIIGSENGVGPMILANPSSGKRGNIVGGGGTISGNSSVTINSGTIDASSIIGGTSWAGNTVTNSSVTINGGTVTGNIYGGSYGSYPNYLATTTGNASVTINGGSFTGNIYGGSYDSVVGGNVNILITGGKIINSAIYVGGKHDSLVNGVTGDATMTVSGGVLTNVTIFGDTEKVEGISTLNVNDGTITGDINNFDVINITGGKVGSNNTVISGAEINVIGGNAQKIVGTGSSKSDEIKITFGKEASGHWIFGTTTDNVTKDIIINADKMVGDYISGVSGADAKAKSVTINLGANLNSTNRIIGVEGGGYVEGNIAINVADGAVLTRVGNDLLVGGAHGDNGGSIGGNTSIVLGSVNGGGVTVTDGNIIGGGGAISGNSSITINSGNINARSIIGGSSWAGGIVSNSSVTINGGIIATADDSLKRAIYGGSYGVAQTTGTGSITITGGDITSKIIAGSEQTLINSTVITIDGGTIRGGSEIYAAGLGDNAKVAAGAVITINGGTLEAGTLLDGQKDKVIAGGSVLNLNGGTVKSDIQNFDNVAMNVDAILNSSLGAVSDVDNINITGFDRLTGTFGSTEIAGSVIGNTGFKFDDVDAILGTAQQVAGADTLDDTSDDVWAVLGKSGDSLVVSWGNTAEQAMSSLDAFGPTNLVFNSAIVDNTGTNSAFTSLDTDDLSSRKNNGSLAS